MIAIVTGASSGIGAEFCRVLDSYNLDAIWLIARRQDRLDEVASSLQTPTKSFSVDLSDREQLDEFLEIVKRESPEIQYLVNCAGFGKFGLSWELSSEASISMIDVNVIALISITDGCIPYMAKNGHIIELCSASAYISMYNLNIYASTKSFVKHFCNGLRNELKPRNISVTEVSPGWVKTDFIDICVEENKVPEKVFKNTVTKEAVVAHAMKCANKGKKRSICGWKNKIIISLSTHFPNFAARVWMKQFT